MSGRVFVDADERAGSSRAAVVDLVSAHPGAVLALGAGHTHLVDPDLFAQVAAARRIAALLPGVGASRQPDAPPEAT